MARIPYRFDRFALDPDDRQLLRDGSPVELNARYLDALILLASEPGKLISKTRFLDEVWRGVPVTDEALTQCITTLRRQLGDDATRPRFIETVPKHGYRFIAPLASGDPVAPAVPEPAAGPSLKPSGVRGWDGFLRVGRAGMIGGGMAGLLGGMFYGFVGISDAVEPGGGAVSALLVIVCLTALVGLMGGAGVGFGIAASVFAPGRQGAWGVLGGAAGGLVVGAVVKLVGLDAFNLLFGQSPGNITGGPEGTLLGGAVGIGAWLASAAPARIPPGVRIAGAGLIAATAGAVIPMMGGRLMGGSLDRLAERFPHSRLRLDQIGSPFGESGFGPVSQIVTGGLEGLLFGGCIVAAIMVAQPGSRRGTAVD